MITIARLRVWREHDAEDGDFESYEVPFEPGQSVLDGLRWIRANQDPTLAIRFSCINANACKECMMEIDGATAYACTTRLAPREMIVKPLSNKAILRDLVTEIAPPAERLSGVQPSSPGLTRRSMKTASRTQMDARAKPTHD